MKYYKTKNFSKIIASTGFIATISCVLIAIGAIGWFALSKNSNKGGTTSNIGQDQSYIKNNNSYNSKAETPNVESEPPITSTNENINSIPYIEDNTSSKPSEEKQKFIFPVNGNISKGFSNTALQYSATYNDMRLHTGVDILCKKGEDIKSVGCGTVKSVVDDSILGKIITIEYDKEITVKYCGMASINIKENDNVSTGDVIGTSGEIPGECADNPHIHIEVFVNKESVSPLEALELE